MKVMIGKGLHHMWENMKSFELPEQDAEARAHREACKCNCGCDSPHITGYSADHAAICEWVIALRHEEGIYTDSERIERIERDIMEIKRSLEIMGKQVLASFF